MWEIILAALDQREREDRDRAAWAQRVVDDFMASYYLAAVELVGPLVVPIPPLPHDRAVVRTDCAPPRRTRPGGRHWRVSILPADPLVRPRRPVVDLATGVRGEVFADYYVDPAAWARFRVADYDGVRGALK